MTDAERADLALEIITAFEQFAGGFHDAVTVLPGNTLMDIRRSLAEIAVALRQEDIGQYPGCHMLADRIMSCLTERGTPR